MWNYKITQETLKNWSEKTLPLSILTSIPAVRITACSQTMQLFCPFINQDLHVYTPDANMWSNGHYCFCVRLKTDYVSLEPTVCKTIVKTAYANSSHKSLTKHIDPSLATKFKRFKFRPDKQRLSEVVAAYVSHLWDWANTCEFTNPQ